MSKEEINRCIEYYYKNDPHTIWKDLWISNTSIYKKEYKRCTEAFMVNMKKYMNIFQNKDIGQDENQWCFPKGRLHKNENELNCALREFEEETEIYRNDINVDINSHFEEIYIGSNNLIYKTIYYVAQIPFIPKKSYKSYPSNIRKKFISSEFFDMEWLEYSSVYERLTNSMKQTFENINNYIIKRSFKK